MRIRECAGETDTDTYSHSALSTVDILHNNNLNFSQNKPKTRKLNGATRTQTVPKNKTDTPTKQKPCEELGSMARNF